MAPFEADGAVALALELGPALALPLASGSTVQLEPGTDGFMCGWMGGLRRVVGAGVRRRSGPHFFLPLC